MTPQRKWTKEGIEGYLALHPNAILKEIGENFGVNEQRISSVVKSLDIKLPGSAKKIPAKKGTPHSRAAQASQDLAEPSGSEALASYSGSGTKLILVTPLSNNQLVEAIKSGATAYLARETSVEEVGQLAHGGSSIQVDILKGKTYRLSKREIEILRHAAGGYTHSQVGEALGISPQTVKNHLSLIMRKLGANNKAHAVVLALRYGFLSLDEIAPSQDTKQPDGAKEQ